MLIDKRLILIIILLSSFFNSYAQLAEIKSARKAVDTLYTSDKEKALEISQEFIPKSKIAKDTFHITYFLDQAGELNRQLGNLRDAEMQLKECLLFKTNWPDLKDLSITYNNLGKTYKNLGKFELSFFNFLEAYKLMEQAENLFGQGYYLNNIGALFDDQQNYEKAIEYYNRSFEIKKITKDSSGMASTSFNVGLLYYNLNEFEKALSFFKRSYNSISYQRSSTKKVMALSNIALVLLELDKVNEGKKILFDAKIYLPEIEYSVVKLDYLSVLSRIYLNEGLIDSAFHYNRLAITEAYNIGQPKTIQRDLFIKSAILEEINQIDSAFAYLKKGQLYYDSLVSEANVNAIAEMEGKYKFERNLRLLKESELETSIANEALNNNQLKLLYALIAFLVVSALATFAFIQSKANKRNANLLEGQNLLIEKQNSGLNAINIKLSEELGHLKFSVMEKEEILNKVFTKSNEKELSPELISLSKREKEVLANLALGLSDAQLADKLFISKSTIKTHLRRLYSKLLVRSRAEAVAIAHKHGIIGSISA